MNDLQLTCLKKYKAQSLTGADKLFIFKGKTHYLQTRNITSELRHQ